MKHDLDKAVNIKLILCMFEQLLVLKINLTEVGTFIADV
jgi:hypothetical protein